MSQGLDYQAEVEKCNTMEEKFSSLSSLTNTFTTNLCPFKKKREWESKMIIMRLNRKEN